MKLKRKLPLPRSGMRIPARLSLCLPLLLTSCAGSNAPSAPPVMRIDDELLAPTPVPPMPEPFSWHNALLWNADLLTALGHCNRDKAAARRQDKERKAIYVRPDAGAGQPAP